MHSNLQGSLGYGACTAYTKKKCYLQLISRAYMAKKCIIYYLHYLPSIYNTTTKTLTSSDTIAMQGPS